MIDVKNKRCGCEKNRQAVFGFPNDKRATKCVSCAQEGMIDIRSARCGCSVNQQPRFGYPDDDRATKCMACKQDGMIDLKTKLCGCAENKQPTFGFPNDTGPSACAKCRTTGMIDLNNKSCGCVHNKIATFGHEGDIRATKCVACKEPGMTDIRSMRCSCPAQKMRRYGNLSTMKAVACFECKSSDMVDVFSNVCGCPQRKRASFGHEGEERASACAACKTPGMINIVFTKCEMECCVLEPSKSQGRHPDTGKQMCTFAMRLVVIEASRTDPVQEARLMEAFAFKKQLINRGELIMYHALSLAVPELRQAERVLDTGVEHALEGKRKTVEDLRPDAFHRFSVDEKYMGLHWEYDEREDHEQSEQRLHDIADLAECSSSTYVIRVQGHHGNPKKETCKRRIINKNHVYFDITEEGKRVTQETAAKIRKIMAWIKQGLGPDEAAGRPEITYINF